MYGIFKIDGTEWTVKGKCYCIAHTWKEAMKKSVRLSILKGISTIVKKV